MGDLKLVGPDGKPIAPPSKDNPTGLKMAEAALSQPKTIATIDLLPDGRYGLKHIAPIPLIEYAFIVSSLAHSLIAKLRNDAIAAARPGPEEPENPPPSKEG